MAFENFPYVDLHNLNLDWILEQVGKLADIDYQGLLDHNIELSTNYSETDPDTGKVSIKGSLRGAIIDAVSNYYLDKIPMLAEYSEMFTEGSEQDVFGIQTADNKILVPGGNGNQMITGGNPMAALLCMASFLNQGMTYGHARGMFNTDPSQVQFDQMVCSDYVACGLRGISYQNSKAAGSGKNYESAAKSRTWRNNTSLLAPDPKDTLITREMAYIFAAQGALWELDYENFSNVQQGDILFFSSTATAAGVRSNFMNIHHDAVVLDVDYVNRFINVLECGWASSTLFQYSFTSHSSSLYNGPSYDQLKLGPGDLISTRKVWVARPSWPAVEPLKVPQYALESTNSVHLASGYNNVHTYTKSNWGFRKGDIGHLHIRSDMNQLNPDGTGPCYTNLRIAGKLTTPNPDDPDNPTITYPTLWLSTSRGSYKDVPNERDVYFVVDDDYDDVRFMISTSASGEGTDLTFTNSLTFYRL